MEPHSALLSHCWDRNSQYFFFPTDAKLKICPMPASPSVGQAGWVHAGPFGRAKVKTLTLKTGVRADGSVCSLPADLEGLKALLWF